MFYCFIHNWYSTESPCPVCHPTIITTATNITEPPEQQTNTIPAGEKLSYEELENKMHKKYSEDTYDEFKKLASQPKTDRIEVMLEDEFNNDSKFSWQRHLYSTDYIPEEKYPLIKQAIESVLNNDDNDFWGKVNNITSDAIKETISHKYTEKELTDREEKAFNAGRKVAVQPQPPYSMSWVYSTFQDYLNSLKDK